MTGSPLSRAPRAKVLLPIALLLLVGLTVRQMWPAPNGPEMHEFAGQIMGTTYSVKVQADNLSAARRRAISESISEWLVEIDRRMSTYDTASELSHFNRHRHMTPFPLSPLTLAVLEIARDVSERSGGALDVTVAPLVNAWGFGPTGEPRVPSNALLSRERRRVGYNKLHIDIRSGTVRKKNADVVIDLSAVAKGYAVDHVSKGLLSLGVRTFLVEVGGELRAEGRKHDGEAWKVAVEQPDASIRRLHETVDLHDESIATSGDYRNFFDVDGVRYAHIIDPRSGRTIRYAGASVSVIHPQAAVADAWATALTVLGPVDGFAVAEREGLAALFVMRGESGFVSRATSAFGARQRDDGQ